MPKRSKNNQTGSQSRLLRNCSLLFLGLGIGFLTPYLWTLDQLLVGQMASARWREPSRVYARPTVLSQGLKMGADQLEYELLAANYQRASTPLAKAFVRHGQHFRIGASDAGSPPIELSIEGRTVGPIKRLDDGKKLATLTLDPAPIGAIHGSDARDRILIKLEQAPQLLISALQAVEDRDFKYHSGLSWRGIMRAAWQNLRQGRIVQGGSSISQQLVKSLVLNNQRSWLRKFHEAALAFLLEARYSKRDILEVYLNEVFLGQDGHVAIHGVGLAAQHYFGRSLERLDLGQIALLIGMLKGPSQYNPWRHADRAKQRRAVVLNALYLTGQISRTMAVAANQAPLSVLAGPQARNRRFPAMMGIVRQQLGRSEVFRDASQNGLQIMTSLRPWHQRQAERALSEMLDQIELERGLESGTLQGAVVLVDRSDGSIMAAVGDRKPRFAGFNRALLARRPVGSVIKPFVYLAALEQGRRFNLASHLKDQPLVVTLEGGRQWRPRNYDGVSHGSVMMIDALVHSYNQATTWLGLQLGLPAVVDMLGELGLSRKLVANPSLLLGAVELTPTEVAQLYVSLANGGKSTPLNAVLSVIGADDRPMLRAAVAGSSNGIERSAWLIQYALQRAIDEGTGRTLSALLGHNASIAGKTGTSNGMRDSWFAGFSDDLVAVVWVGRDDAGPAGVSGASGALKVFGELFGKIPWQPLNSTPPLGVALHWVAPETGLLANEGCEGARQLPFAETSTPSQWDPCTAPQARRWRFWPFGDGS